MAWEDPLLKNIDTALAALRALNDILYERAFDRHGNLIPERWREFVTNGDTVAFFVELRGKVESEHE